MVSAKGSPVSNSRIGIRTVVNSSAVLVFASLLGCPSPMATTGSTARTSAPSSGASSCDAARFTLDASTVVATVGGEPVLAEKLGPDLKSAEDRALRTYCDAVSEARRAALDNHLNDMLVERAAKKESKTPQEFVQSRVMAEVKPVPEEALLAFYEANKGPDAPPFELVRPQVEQALQREQIEAAIGALLANLRKEASVVEQLPDVAAPPFDIAITANTAVKGADATAKVTVVEFADFECPYCSNAADSMRTLAGKYGDRVRFAYRHFPLSFHPNARRAAEFAHCAQEQGKFWEFHDKAYANQRALDDTTLRGHATTSGMDVTKLDECLASERPARAVTADMEAAQQVGVEGTPSFYINGRAYRGNPTPEGIGAAIEAALKGAS
jgi:protein-disulfide isomerase